MKTRLLIIAIALLFSANLAVAQEAKMRFGVLGGINMQTFNGKDFDGDKLENDMIIGYHGGVNVQIPIVPEFYFQPGVLFTTKGAKNTSGSVTSTYKISYIEVPLNLVYKGLLGNGYIMLGFGPYISYGIMGSANYEGGSLSYENDIVFQNVVESGDPLLDTYFKAFDAGGNIFVGYEMGGGIFAQLNTQFGMLQINPEDNRIPDNESVLRNTGFGFSLGYRF
ncbi:MAG: PorT family protein [Bacteroidetes bacterium HGW-Bacteroidetes-15]|nr:MAG: PorT family protein [Bacteroidetes bacterium HGW-Bacteroidetes-15]